jgi:DNA-binding transcriptional ArsR family regulator
MDSLHGRQLDALGDVTRRAVLQRLRKGPLPVGEIARGLYVTRPAVSQHLRVLKKAGLVRDESAGRNRYYRLDPRGFAILRRYFDDFWAEALDAFKVKVEER